MAYEQKNNTGSLFRNEKKETENHPDYNGSMLIDGTEYWISGWINTAKSSGKKYFGLSFKKKEAAPGKPALSGLVEHIAESPDDDDVPF
tara:strand:+ start:3558 stop:3824 length:267 start_codon:yes stop_codon:yes gene_type:complete